MEREKGGSGYLEHVEGFVLVHVKRGGADAALLERGRQPLIVHQPAARRVHKERAWNEQNRTWSNILRARTFNTKPDGNSPARLVFLSVYLVMLFVPAPATAFG